MPYVYILECADGSYYTGSTWDLERRLWEHQNGLGAKHTAKRLPVKLLYCEECERIEDAYAREKQIQGWGRKMKQALMAGNVNLVHRLAECRNESHWRNFGFGSAQPTGSAQPLGSCEPTTSAQSVTPCRSLSETRSLSEVEGNITSHANPLAPFDSAQGTENIESSDKSKRILE
jgi:putative endonuclease